MQFHLAEDTTITYATLLLMGDSGAGKTKLASMMPNAFFFDIEGGAHHTGCDRITFDKAGSSYNTLLALLKEVARLSVASDGLLHWKPRDAPHEFTIGTLVLDSLDELQGVIDKTINATRFDYWREMLEKMHEIVDTARCCNCHVVLVAHTRVYEPTEEEKKKYNAVPLVSLALQGQIRNLVPNWVDVSLNLVVEPDGTKRLITQQGLINGKSYYAKDRYHLFKGNTFVITFDQNGQIKGDILKHILDRCAGGSRQDHEQALLTEAKEALIEAAVAQGITAGRADIEGMKRLITLLKAEDLSPDNALSKREQCLSAIAAWQKPSTEEDPIIT